MAGQLTEEEKAALKAMREATVKAPLEARIKELEAVITKPSVIGSWIKTYLYQLFLYLPNALVLFGPIIDSINQEFRYTLASIIGLASIGGNWIFGKILSLFLKSFSKTTAVNCTVPGFESLESFFSPQGIVLPATMFTYLLIDLGFHRDPSKNMGTAFLMFGFLIAQTLVMYGNGCFKAYYFTYSFVTILLALLVGLICGWFGWIGVRFAAPQRLPSAAGTPFAPPSSSGGTTTHVKAGFNPITPISPTPDVGTCSPPNDQDQFVCEAYKDGEVVTSTIVS